MNQKTKYNPIKMGTFVVMIVLISTVSPAQSPEKKAMQALSFMIGHWKGSGQSFPKQDSSPYDVVSEVKYDLSGELLVLRHRSYRGDQPVLNLHTIIHYNSKDQQYLYYPFTSSGARPFACNMQSQRLVCLRDDYRLIFQLNEHGQFNEYGEKRADGQWQKTFEDKLSASKTKTID